MQVSFLFSSVSLQRGVPLRAPLTADVVQLTTAYILTELREVCCCARCLHCVLRASLCRRCVFNPTWNCANSSQAIM